MELEHPSSRTTSCQKEYWTISQCTVVQSSWYVTQNTAWLQSGTEKNPRDRPTGQPATTFCTWGQSILVSAPLNIPVVYKLGCEFQLEWETNGISVNKVSQAVEHSFLRGLLLSCRFHLLFIVATWSASASPPESVSSRDSVIHLWVPSAYLLEENSLRDSLALLESGQV